MPATLTTDPPVTSAAVILWAQTIVNTPIGSTGVLGSPAIVPRSQTASVNLLNVSGVLPVLVTIIS